jgi:uncharacterized OsmC-like protein/pimeloyl-ACP methyl ester carboxylesterase
MPTRPFDFTGAEGRRLSGRLEMPMGRLHGWAIFAHCFTCGKDNVAAVRIARALASVGIGVLRFDFAGLGESEGAFASTSFSGNVRDLIAATQAMAAAEMTPGLLVGHSLGGAAVLAAAGDLPSVKAVVTLAAPFDVANVLHQFDPQALEAIAAQGEADVRLAGRPFRVGQGFIDDLRLHDQGARIAALHRPLLVMHGPLDETVGVDNATSIFLAARHPKSFVSLDHADHLLSRKADADFAAAIIAAWASRYLPELAEQPVLPTDAEAEETRAGKFQVTIRAGGATFLADEPVSVGGLGTGPSPYDLLSSALAACTTMTLRLYADGKGWPVTRIRTAVGHRRDKGTTPADLFTRRIAIDGAIDADQRARLLEIADNCPVHRTLERGACFDTVLGEPPADAEPAEAHVQAMARVTEG